MQSDEGMTERSKFAIPSKTIGTVAPDKSAVMFKVFVTDKDGMMNFVSGKNTTIKPIYDECIQSVQLWDLSGKNCNFKGTIGKVWWGRCLYTYLYNITYMHHFSYTQ